MELMEQLSALIADAPGVLAAWVFGSVARGTARDESDLDVAVLLDDARASALPHQRALRDLAARLEAVSGRRVDLVVLGLHDPIVAHRVLDEGRRLLDRDPMRRVEFEGQIYSRYLDWAPVYDAIAAASLETNRRWARGER